VQEGTQGQLHTNKRVNDEQRCALFRTRSCSRAAASEAPNVQEGTQGQLHTNNKRVNEEQRCALLKDEIVQSRSCK